MTPVGAAKMAAALAAAPMSAVPAKKCRELEPVGEAEHGARQRAGDEAECDAARQRRRLRATDCVLRLQRRQHRGGGKPQRHAEHLADRKDGKA